MTSVYLFALKSVLVDISKWAVLMILFVLLIIMLFYLFGGIWCQKAKGISVIIILTIVGIWAWYAIPRIVDYQTKGFVIETHATLYLDPTNKDNGNTLRFGTGSIKTKEGKWVKVDGLDFIDFPIANGYPDSFDGTFVFARRSRQLVYYRLE